MKEREYFRLKRQIEAEYREKMHAFDLVWKMAGKPAQRPERLPRAAVLQLVQAFLNQWRDEVDDEPMATPHLTRWSSVIGDTCDLIYE